MATLVERLVDDLDSDLANRRREIADLRHMVRASMDPRRSLLARSCHVMAYSHWEGFVKGAVRRYIEYVQSRGLYVGDLNTGLQGLALRDAVRTAAQPERSVDEVVGLLAAIDERGTLPFAVDADMVVKTGNLTAATLQSILGCAGLTYLEKYQMRENFIDEVLCGRRHRIAHGGWQPITADEARAVASDVLDLCTDLNQQVQEAALYERYRL
jgi:hypothetical protein